MLGWWLFKLEESTEWADKQREQKHQVPRYHRSMYRKTAVLLAYALLMQAVDVRKT